MLNKHEYLATSPFDLYELHLFQLVAKHGSFTRAAEIAGLTQSAITRQIQGMEAGLGLQLFERTTRTVRLSPAGEFLHRESLKLVGDVDSAMQRLREEFAGARKVVRVGVSQTIGLAYLPGFFHANLRRLPEVTCRLSYRPSAEILPALLANDLDLGVICPPKRLPKAIMITHKFADDFTLIAPGGKLAEPVPVRPRDAPKWAAAQNWLMIAEASNTGQRLRRWMTRNGCAVTPAMELDSFDLIINLVSLGMGVAFVPIRALALYGGKRTIRRIALPERFTRELVVVARRQRTMPAHLSKFIGNILF